MDEGQWMCEDAGFHLQGLFVKGSCPNVKSLTADPVSHSSAVNSSLMGFAKAMVGGRFRDISCHAHNLTMNTFGLLNEPVVFYLHMFC